MRGIPLKISPEEKKLRVAKQKAEWRERNREKSKDKHRQTRYGLKPGEYALRVKQQNELCAICSRKRRLAVDHCHITGRVRGLLCYPCNVALGNFNDDANMVKKAAKYLE